MEGGIKRPTPVTLYANGASPYGVMQMAGNVWEWCASKWGEDTSNLRGMDGRVIRGGSFGSIDFSGRFTASATYRAYLRPVDRDEGIGFRMVCHPRSS